MASSIDGQYKVIACQLKTHWLAPGVWSYYIWEIKNGRFKLHNLDVCPSAYVGSFVKHATGDVVVDDAVQLTDLGVPVLGESPELIPGLIGEDC